MEEAPFIDPAVLLQFSGRQNLVRIIAKILDLAYDRTVLGAKSSKPEIIT